MQAPLVALSVKVASMGANGAGTTIKVEIASQRIPIVVDGLKQLGHCFGRNAHPLLCSWTPQTAEILSNVEQVPDLAGKVQPLHILPVVLITIPTEPEINLSDCHCVLPLLTSVNELHAVIAGLLLEPRCD
eukprot:207626-Rhodomonas_salina.1